MANEPSVGEARFARAFSFRIGCGTLVGSFALGLLASLLWQPLFLPVFIGSALLIWVAAVFSPSPNSGRCPHCKRLVKFDAVVCSHCGNALPTAPTVQAANSVGTSHPQNTASYPQPAGPTTAGVTFGRETPIPPQPEPAADVVGQEIADAASSEPARVSQPAPTIYCLNCGTELVEGASFCGKCGTARGTAKARQETQSDVQREDPVSATRPSPLVADPPTPVHYAQYTPYTLADLDTAENTTWVSSDTREGQQLKQFPLPREEGWYGDPLDASQARFVSATGWSGQTRAVTSRRPPVEVAVVTDPKPPTPVHGSGPREAPSEGGTFSLAQLDTNERGEWVTPDSAAGQALAACPPPTSSGWYVDPLDTSKARFVADSRWTGKTRLILPVR